MLGTLALLFFQALETRAAREHKKWNVVVWLEKQEKDMT